MVRRSNSFEPEHTITKYSARMKFKPKRADEEFSRESENFLGKIHREGLKRERKKKKVFAL